MKQKLDSRIYIEIFGVLGKQGNRSVMDDAICLEAAPSQELFFD